MHGALLVEEALRASRREHAFVPDVRVDVEAAAAVEAKADEVRGLDIVSGKREGDEKRSALEREEELTAVRMVIRVPEQDPPRQAGMPVVGRCGIVAVGKNVMAADGIVATVENVSLPFADE